MPPFRCSVTTIELGAPYTRTLAAADPSLNKGTGTDVGTKDDVERDGEGDNRQHREKSGDVIEVGGGRGHTMKRRKKRHGVRRQGEQEWAANVTVQQYKKTSKVVCANSWVASFYCSILIFYSKTFFYK